MSPGKLLQCKI